jgi:hypothetical protein
LFGAPGVDDSTLADTTRAVGPLEHGTLYYWRVRASNEVGFGPWSTTWNFRTIVEFPDTVVLHAPSDGANVQTDNLTLTWLEGRPEVDHYWMEYSADSLFAGSIVDSTVADTSATVTALQPNQRYWWRIRAHNAAGWGSFSDTRTFTTIVTSVRSEAAIPVEFGLSQNFPNPFNPTTVIRYALPVESHVLLEVFNVLGQRVTVLVDQDQAAGYHSVTLGSGDLGGGGLPSGVYFYRIQSGDPSKGSAGRFVDTKKFILLR